MSPLEKRYEIVSALPAQAALDRLKSVLSNAGVAFEAADLRITSTRTPLAVLGVQPRLYSRGNWVGLNPFAFISAIDILVVPGQKRIGTSVEIRVSRRRSAVFAAAWTACALLAGLAMPQPAGMVLTGAVLLVSWLGMVSVMGGYLVGREIQGGLTRRGGEDA